MEKRKREAFLEDLLPNGVAGELDYRVIFDIKGDEIVMLRV